MKVIKNWEIKAIVNEKEITSIPLPGCIMIGTIDNQEIKIEILDINLMSLKAIDVSGKEYILSDPKKEYVNIVNKIIKLAKNKNSDKINN